MVGYFCGTVGLGTAAVAHMLAQPGNPQTGAFAVLLFLACATVPLKVRLPGVDRSVSLSYVFSFAAVAELPAASPSLSSAWLCSMKC